MNDFDSARPSIPRMSGFGVAAASNHDADTQPRPFDRADFLAITTPHDVKHFRIGWSRGAADTNLSTVDSKMI